MKTYFWVFAIAVFILSLAHPALANNCGGNGGRYAQTTVAPARPLPPAPAAGTAQGAGMKRD